LDSNIAQASPNSRKERAATPKMTTEHWGYLWNPVRKKYACRMIYMESSRGDFDLHSLPRVHGMLVMTP
jgi:hypothetical protein